VVTLLLPKGLVGLRPAAWRGARRVRVRTA
jgi:hypothetical protein